MLEVNVWQLLPTLKGRYLNAVTNTPYLTLEAEDLEMDVQYKFAVKVTADTRNSVEASHHVMRRDVNAPIVVIYSDVILTPELVSPDNE